MKRIPVIDVATRNVITITPSTKAMDVLELAKKTNLHTFPVLEDNKLAGIISLKDIFKIFYPYEDTLEKYRPILHSWEKIYEEYEKDIFNIHIKRETLLSTTANDIMSKDFKVIYADDTIGTAYNILKDESIHLLPVLSENNELVGVITLFDIIYFIFTKISKE